jgi:hypothetical protein
VLALALAQGCGPGGVDGLTDPMIVQGALLGLVEPESEDIDLSETDFDKGSAVTVFVADAKSLADVEQAGVVGVQGQVRVGDEPAVALAPGDEAGQYTAYSDDGLVYQTWADAVVSLSVDERSFGLVVELPEAANVRLPEQGLFGEDLPVDMSGGDFDQVLATVINTKSGRVTWSNEPQGLSEWNAFTNAEAASSFLIPAEAFTEPNALFAVGVAGLRMADAADFDEINTALSGMQAGQLEFSPYLVLGE